MLVILRQWVNIHIEYIVFQVVSSRSISAISPSKVQFASPSEPHSQQALVVVSGEDENESNLPSSVASCVPSVETNTSQHDPVGFFVEARSPLLDNCE